ncbi:MAG: hypothetical protein M3N11_04835 [Actinomycetota bacterium]|nr:hypothetical protein [Actinomycetota bacterium]
MALVIAVGLVLGAGVAALVLIGDDDSASDLAGDQAPSTTTNTSEAPPTTAEPPPTTTEPRTPLERAVVELSAFVARERGLEFLRPVDVELLADGPFEARLLRDVEEDREEVDQSEKVLRAMGLLEPGVDLFETYVSFFGGAVLGFYDPETDELVVRGVELTPYVRSTLVHELTHALDDQHFELHRPEVEDADDEAAFAFSALVEGVGVAVESSYQQGFSAGEQAQADEEAANFAGRVDYSSLPPIVTSLVQFPYLVGPSFVSALVGHGGDAEVDAAFRDPPTTSEQIIYPDVYLAGDDPAAVPPPPAGGPVIEEGTYGQWVLYLTLAEVLGGEVANRAAEGWGGDSYVAWDEGPRSCVRLAFAMDTPQDLRELDDAWRQWAQAHGDATVDATGGTVTVTACG